MLGFLKSKKKSNEKKNPKPYDRSWSLHITQTLHLCRLSSSVHTSPKPGFCKRAPLLFELVPWKASFPLPYSSITHGPAIITSTMALGSSSARKSCSMASMMFFQPSRRMSPWRWAKWNTVFAAIWALELLPKTVGRFSIDCRKEEWVAISQQEMFSFQHKLGQTVQNWLRERQQFYIRCLDNSSAHIHFAQKQGQDGLPDTSWTTEPPRHKLSKSNNNTEHFESACWKLTNTNLFCYGNSIQDQSLVQKVPCLL